MLTKRCLILVAIFLFGTTTNSLSAWGQNTHFQGSNWLEEWLSDPLPGQPQQSTANNQRPMVSPTVGVSDRSDITSHRKPQETAQKPSAPYDRGDIVGATATDAHAQDWYFTVAGGLAFVGDSTGVASTTNNDITVSFDTGFGLSAAVGRRFSNFRLEAELGYGSSDADQETSSGVTNAKNGTGTTWSVMANGLYDINMDSNWIPYVGLGIGYATVNLDLDASTNFNSIDDSDATFAFQALTGVNYRISEQTALGLGYRYFRMGDVDLTDSTGAVIQDGDGTNSHNIEARLTVDF